MWLGVRVRGPVGSLALGVGGREAGLGRLSGGMFVSRLEKWFAVGWITLGAAVSLL
jgi:hypothetical protein